MFEIKIDSIVDDYIVNSKHTANCSSKEFQIPEECKCWRLEFAKSILAKQEMKKKIYVSSKVKFAPIWKKFRLQGYPIVASWLDEADKTDSNMVELWKKNIDESSSCGVLVYFSEIPPELTSKKQTVSLGGLVEVGSALSMDIPVVWAAMEYPSVCKHPNIKFVNGCDDVDSETEIRFALDEAMKILNLTSPTQTKTLAEVYLDFIQTKWNPKYNFNFGLDDWKKNQTIQNVQEYLDCFFKYYPAKWPGGEKINLYFDQGGNEICESFTGKSENLVTKWWDMKNGIKCDLINETHPLYVWDSFVAWCYHDELPRKTFGIGLKEEVEFAIKIHEDQVAHIPSVKCKDAKGLSVEITDQTIAHIPSVKLGKSAGVQNIPVVQMTTINNNPKARKLKRIKTHSSYVKCTNKSRRVVTCLTADITCGHCLKLGKKKGLWT